MVPRWLRASFSMVWLLPGMFWYSEACTTMMSVRLATRAANMSAMTMSVPVRRLPSETRPSTPVLPWTAESEVVVISVSTPVASSPARKSSATAMKLARSEEPPWLMKGSVRPVRGMSLVTPPTMMKACSTMSAVQPTAVNELTSLLARAAVTKPRMAKHRYRSRMPAAPRRPISSAMAAKMKSLSTTGMGMSPARPRPTPTPNRSPSAMEYRAWVSW